MILLYSDTTRELELRASGQELYQLSKALEGDGTTMECETAGVTVSPYSKLLRHISVAVAHDQDVEIRIAEDEDLQISGGRPKLSIFAEAVYTFAKEWGEGEHLHIEYYDNHPYLAPTSLPLVMTHL